MSFRCGDSDECNDREAMRMRERRLTDESSAGYRFGDCELLLATRELRVGGASRPVEPQVFDLLLCLVKAGARVVSRDELVAEVWRGRVVSDSAISARISAARSAIGDDGTAQRWIRTVPRRGFRFAGDVQAVPVRAGADADAGGLPATATPSDAHQKVRFCRSADGTRIAWGTIGAGYPLVKSGHWLTHLEHDWHSPIWRPILDELGRRFLVTRYDQRGNGLSEWEVADFSLDRFVEDLEAVVDSARLERFALYGTSQGAAIAIAYAVRHPDRVSHLILQGGFARGRLRRGSDAEREQGEAMLTLIRHGWGRPGSVFVRAFASMFVPGATREQLDSLVELQLRTTSPENAARLRAAVDRFDVSDLLPGVRVPTLVLHSRDDAIQPVDQGRELASGIPGAEFVLLESANHVLLPEETAWRELFDEMGRFVAG
jgi:pimeloyl-ACP methyl ester carboxylesterase/DNA-binding winged helix-turn-helix (wHTH) protein